MKKIIKIICIAMSAVLCLSAASCKKEQEQSQSGTQGRPIVSTAENHQLSLSQSETWFIENNSSQYVIALPGDASISENFAAEELNYFLNMAAGVTLPVQTDPQVTEGSKFISLGKNSVSEHYEVAEPDIDDDGFILKTCDDSLIILDNGGYFSRGVLFGVYEFLSHLLHFDTFSADEIYIDRVNSVKMLDIDALEIPDLGGRSVYSDLQTGVSLGNRMRKYSSQRKEEDSLMMYYFTVPDRAWHNSFEVLDPEKYSEDHPLIYSSDFSQLCYTAHDDDEEYKFMLDTSVKYFTDYIASRPALSEFHFTFTQSDTTTLCSCKTCTDMNEKYGAFSATIVLFMNDLAEGIQGYLDENSLNVDFSICFFAYHQSQAAPVKTDENGNLYPEMMLSEHVFPLIAIIEANGFAGLDESANGTAMTDIDNWAKLSEEIGIWKYSANFRNLIMPYNWTNNFVIDRQKLAQYDVCFFFDEDASMSDMNMTNFYTLKDYLSSKIEWNTGYDAEELTDKFFNNYFKQAAEPMRELYDAMRTYLTKLYYETGYYGFYNAEGATLERFPKGIINYWMSLINSAYSAIEPVKNTDSELYTRLYNRITLESLSIRYLDLQLYDYTYNTTQLQELRQDYIDDTRTVTLLHFSENYRISYLIQEWGVQ